MELYKGKRWWLALPVLAAPLLLMAVFPQGDAVETTKTVYRESTVTRGDITVGVTESATATLKTHALTFEVAASIEDIAVRAGQKVKAGEVVGAVSTESIEEALSKVKADYQEAVYSLSEAQLAKQKGEVDAQATYQNTLISSEFAEDTYSMAVSKLERAISSAQSSVNEVETEIRTYNRLLRYVSDYADAEEYYQETKAIYDYAQTYLDEARSIMDKYRAEHLAADPSWEAAADDAYMDLVERYQNASEELTNARLEYEDTGAEFDDRYDASFQDDDSIKAARRKAYAKLAEAGAELAQAQYNLQIQTRQADVTRQSNLTKAEIAETTYQMELAKLANNVVSKQQLVTNYAEQIAKYSGYLKNHKLVSPCNGVVTAVNASAGDDFNAGSTILSIADSDNVYVYLSVTQDDVTDISLDQQCTVSMDAFETVTFDATVESITTSPMRSASASASYSVALRLQGDTSGLYEGMTGRATIVTRQQKDVLQVSLRAVYTGGDGGSYVKVKDAEGNLAERAVETGFSDGRNVEIVSGLSEGEVVVVESQVRNT